MSILKRFWLFLLGGCGYVLLELAFRGRSHITMFFAGGLCFLLVGGLETASPRLPALPRAIVGGLIITAVELGFGLAFNRNWQIWDYRGNPGNFLGQICPLFTLLWIPLAFGAGKLYRALR